MAHNPKSIHSLAALAVLFIIVLSSQSRAQGLNSALEGEVLKAYADSTKEVTVNGVRIRGHEIGNGKFRTCEGKSIDIGQNPIRRSDKCRDSSGTHTIKGVSGEFMDFDAEQSTVKFKDEDGNLTDIFVPLSARLVTGGRFDKSKTIELDGMGVRGRRITIFFVIPGRAEAIAVGY